MPLVRMSNLYLLSATQTTPILLQICQVAMVHHHLLQYRVNLQLCLQAYLWDQVLHLRQDFFIEESGSLSHLYHLVLVSPYCELIMFLIIDKNILIDEFSIKLLANYKKFFKKFILSFHPFTH